MDDWRRFANAQRQEQLIAMAEAIVASLKTDEEAGKASDLPATARALRELHVKWQDVAEAPRHSAQRLWDRFRTATDFIRSRCETFFAQQREERTTNLQKKAVLVEEAEALATSADWSRTAARLQELQTAWQESGTVPREAGPRSGPPVPRGLQHVLRPPPRRSGDAEEDLVREPREEGSALRARRNPRRVHRVGRRVGRDEAAAVRVEDDRTGAPQQVRSGVEPIPRRRRSLLRALPQPSPDRDRGQDRRARSARGRSRGARRVRKRRRRRQIWPRACSSYAPRGTAACRFLAVEMRPLTDRWQAALTRIVDRRAEAFKGTDLDPAAVRQKMDKLIARVESYLSDVREAPCRSDPGGNARGPAAVRAGDERHGWPLQRRREMARGRRRGQGSAVGVAPALAGRGRGRACARNTVSRRLPAGDGPRAASVEWERQAPGPADRNRRVERFAGRCVAMFLRPPARRLPQGSVSWQACLAAARSGSGGRQGRSPPVMRF